jgi:hypothetical protein
LERLRKNKELITSGSLQKKRRRSSKNTKVEQIETTEKSPIENNQKPPTPVPETESVSENLKKSVDEEKLKELLPLHEKSLREFIELVNKYDSKKNKHNQSGLDESEEKSAFLCFNCFGKKDNTRVETSIDDEDDGLNAFETMMMRHEENYKKFQKNIELIQEKSKQKGSKNQKNSDSVFDSEQNLKNFKILLERHKTQVGITLQKHQKTKNYKI